MILTLPSGGTCATPGPVVIAQKRERMKIHPIVCHTGRVTTTMARAPTGTTSWDLVRRVQAGEREAFGELYTRHVERVFGLLLSRTANRSLAEDLTAGVFELALRNIDTVTERGQDFGAWLTTVANHHHLDHVKCHATRFEVGVTELPDREALERLPEEMAVERDMAGRLWRAVEGLSDDQRRCVTLRYAGGLTVRETAVVLDRSEGAVKTLQNRAFAALRLSLGGQDTQGHTTCAHPLCRRVLPKGARGLCCGPVCVTALAGLMGEPTPGDRCCFPGCDKPLTTSQRRHWATSCGPRCKQRIEKLRKPSRAA